MRAIVDWDRRWGFGLAALGRPRHVPPGERLQEGLRDRFKPLAAIVMAIQLRVEGQEAGEVALLGVDGAVRLAGHLGAEILLGQGQ